MNLEREANLLRLNQSEDLRSPKLFKLKRFRILKKILMKLKMNCLCYPEGLTVSGREIKATCSKVQERRVVASSLLQVKEILVEKKSLVMSATSQDTTSMSVLNSRGESPTRKPPRARRKG